IWTNDIEGEIWVYSPDLKSRERLLRGVIVNDIFQAADNSIWLATYGQGVFCIPSLYVKNFKMPIGLLVTADVVLDKSIENPIIVSPHYTPSILKDNVIQASSLNIPRSLRKKRISAIIRPRGQDYLVATYSFLYRERNGILDSIKCRSFVGALYQSTNGEYWSGERMGLARINKNFNEILYLQEFDKRIVRAISEDFSGNIIAGTDIGLYIADHNGWKVLNKLSGLPDNYVNVIYADTTNQCHWIGTNGGLCKFTSKGEVVAFDNPLTKIRCNSIEADDIGNIWIATSNGLVRYAQGEFDLFNEEDGLPSDIFKLRYDETTGYLYALSLNTLTRIETEKFVKQGLKQRFQIVLKDKLIGATSLRSENKDIQLPFTSKYFTLRYSIPFYKSREGWSAHYRIDNNAWVPLQTLTDATIQDLPYGKSTVEIKITDSNSRLLSEATLKVFNPTPLYRQAWFLVVFSFLVLSMIIWITMLFIQRHARKKEVALLAVKQRMELEHKALRNMLSPHFMNNAINSIQAFVTKNDQRNTLSYLAKFARLMRANLELLENNLVSIEKELHNLDLYLSFEMLRFSGNLTYSIEAEQEIRNGVYKMPSLILQPFVENSIWHGILPKESPGHVLVKVTLNDNNLHIIIDDDGIGLEESKRRKEFSKSEKPSRGIAIIENRFALLNKIKAGHSFTLVDKRTLNVTATGTRVTIILPFYNAG
ncbi:sensor histidine kinase, partial [Chryseosolibacter indicus]